MSQDHEQLSSTYLAPVMLNSYTTTMKSQFDKIILFLALCAPAILLFAKLFMPTPQLIVTPDFGRSDAWHMSFSAKFLLSENLKKGNIPLWSSAIGAGFPVHGEGQTGIFFLPNILLYTFFDTVAAYNLSWVIYTFLATVGMYFWMRLMGMSQITAVFTGITFAYSGVFATHLTHNMIYPGIACIPWVLALTLRLSQNPSLFTLALLSFILAQVQLIGFPQTSFITYIFSFVYSIFLSTATKNKKSFLLCYITALLLSFGAAAIQIIPSYEFLKETSVTKGFSPSYASYFSFPIQHILTLVDPYLLGNPQNGTYPPFYEKGSVFWENTAYVGVSPLLIIFAYMVHRKKLHRSLFLFFSITLFLSLLLMLGRHSPLYFIYSFWPFTLFRVPSRFIWIFEISLIVLSGIALQSLMKRHNYTFSLRILIIFFTLVNSLHLAVTWERYHAFDAASNWIEMPKILENQRPIGRILEIGSEIAHNQTFLTQGWTDIAPYLALKNTLSPNSNLLWGISQYDVYAGRQLRRVEFYNEVLNNNLKSDSTVATMSATYQRLLNLASIDTLVSAIPLTQKGLVKQKTYQEGDIMINTFHNPLRLPHAYLATNTILATTKEAAQLILQNDEIDFTSSVIVEKMLTLPRADKSGTVQITQSDDHLLTLSVKDASESILVVTDTYYPGWVANIDGTPTEIFPVNIRFRGVHLPAGDHHVTMEYRPASFTIGSIISAITLLILMGLAVSPHLVSAFRTLQISPQRELDRRRSHGT